MNFKISSKFPPAGDQPKAIEKLVRGVKDGREHQTLLGVTGSGKTFTVANVIEKIGKPALVIAHNKTLAAQLAQEYREFFPENAVHYFVSYYDFYQPEAYMPVTDTYIEKEAMINEEIERLRHASTEALLTRKDVIIVASVSCIYGLGSPEEYEKVNIKVSKGDKVERGEFLRKLIYVHYERTNADLSPGTFRAIGNTIEIMPVSEKQVYRLEIIENRVEKIEKIDAITREVLNAPESFYIFPAKHFITPEDERNRALKDIKAELQNQLKKFEKEGKLLEADRLKRRTGYDMSMIREVGYCTGIENYSRHFDGRNAGEPPHTLLSYFPKTKDGKPDFLTIIDESHVTVSQIGGMYAGDASRKETLIEHGFRLPSAKDNRPLKFEEFSQRVGQIIYTSATPGKYELEKSGSGGVAEQVIRPTGLIDPEVSVKPVSARESSSSGYPGQIQDFIKEAIKDVKKGGRVIATTLTKKMAEDLSEYLKDPSTGSGRAKIKAEYLHSDIKTIERIEILTKFRKGEFDVLVGVNLLREGLDLPEVSFIGILDADKEGFLRSETSLIQIIGRAARNVDGRVILYADHMTGSMQRAIDETLRRRNLQIAYNEEHGITPQTIKKEIKDITDQLQAKHKKTVGALLAVDTKNLNPSTSSGLRNLQKLIKQKEKQMNASVKILDFETAAILRDEIKELEKISVK
ncbi:MAG TPA: excinuclease ABC subunit UvrB [Candidatus Paceibacterota bacterium]